MRRLITSYIDSTKQQPIKKGSLEHLQDAYKEAVSCLARHTIGGGFDPTKWYVLYGCERTVLSPGLVNVSGGAVFRVATGEQHGEILLVDPVTSFTVTTPNVLVLEEVISQPTGFWVDPTADPTEFTDANDYYVHYYGKAQWSALTSAPPYGVLFTNLVFIAGRSTIPHGSIIDWSIPAGSTYSANFNNVGVGISDMKGWAVCAGQNVTLPSGAIITMPDLRSRFTVAVTPAVSGAPSSTLTAYNPGNTGGLETVRLSLSEMPRHTHGGVFSMRASDPSSEGWRFGTEVGFYANQDDRYTVSIPDGSHTMADALWLSSGRSAANAAYPIRAAGGDIGTGLAVPHENRPPYYAVYKIMKIY
jgi:microcystin-dependent protein